MTGNQITFIIIAVVALVAHTSAQSVWESSGNARVLEAEEIKEVLTWFNRMRSEVSPPAGDLQRMVNNCFFPFRFDDLLHDKLTSYPSTLNFQSQMWQFISLSIFC